MNIPSGPRALARTSHPIPLARVIPGHAAQGGLVVWYLAALVRAMRRSMEAFPSCDVHAACLSHRLRWYSQSIPDAAMDFIAGFVTSLLTFKAIKDEDVTLHRYLMNPVSHEQ